MFKPVLLLPTYNRWSVNRMAVSNFTREFPGAAMIEGQSSCLGHCFNMVWQFARQAVEKGEITHAIMLHSDVFPTQQNWGSLLLNETENIMLALCL